MITLDRRTGPAAALDLGIGACAQVALLGALGAGTGVGTVGLLAGLGYLVGLVMVLVGALHRARTRALGPADRVTLARAVLVGAVTALVAGYAPAHAPLLVVIAAVALALDGVDGQVARRTGTVSDLGARFDMEVDAVLILVLSAHVAGQLGPWVLAIGLMRYAFVLAGRALPWLRGSLPPSYAAKTVAAVQGIVLIVASAQVLPHAVAVALVALALAALCWSFGRSVILLGARRGATRTPQHAAP
ncbi:CDP-alcohol phosphatidyltransferase family protein [Pseudonocardia sp. GCM10023141]|uniref:CDP-alcohol phosphatidyltransferase family protein n=1 Tax=Pseudonocardia sp. GCM10023141 TaxID=3252653 RepID=UPI00360D9429